MVCDIVFLQTFIYYYYSFIRSYLMVYNRTANKQLNNPPVRSGGFYLSPNEKSVRGLNGRGHYPKKVYQPKKADEPDSILGQRN